MKINWKQKLSSRKFWVAVTGFVTALLVMFGIDNLTIEKVAGLISAEGVLIAYIFSEGAVDANRIEKQEDVQPIPLIDPTEAVNNHGCN